jgi:hypothetical protein
LLVLCAFFNFLSPRTFASPPGLPLPIEVTCDPQTPDQQTSAVDGLKANPAPAQPVPSADPLTSSVQDQVREIRRKLTTAQENFEHVSRAVLRCVASPLGCLLAEDDTMLRRVYYVPDLVMPNAAGGGPTDLIKWITTNIRPNSWQSAGGTGAIDFYPLGSALVVNQRQSVLDAIEKALNARRN